MKLDCKYWHVIDECGVSLTTNSQCECVPECILPQLVGLTYQLCDLPSGL